MDFSNLDCLGADTPSLEAVGLGNGVMRRGMKGDGIAAMQRLLKIADDGDFGPATEAAVKSFQQAHGLTVDGIVGRETVTAAMNEALGKPKPVQAIDFSDSPEVITVKKSAPAKTTASVPPPAESVKAPPASAITVSAEQRMPFSTKVAYGLGGLAALGLGYAILKS